MTEAGPLQVQREPGRWRLRGQIDERSGLMDLAAEVSEGELAVDLAEVSYINSLGVRDWSVFLRRLNARGVAVRLERCAEIMVHQMNMIVDAKGAAEVRSFMAPYGCDACGWEGHVVLITDEIRAPVEAGEVPSARCGDCGGPARFTDFADHYFLFLSP